MLTASLPVSSQQNVPVRIWFVQLLRAAAILLILLDHSILWNADEHLLKGRIFNYLAPIRHLLHVLSQLHIKLDLIGIAIFFLISGFLIPFSIKKYGPISFLVTRLFRIFPVYAIVLVFIASFSAIYFADLHAPLHTIMYFPSFSAGCLNTQDWLYYLWNFLLLPEHLGKPFLEPVVWTLRVELVFYLLAAFLNLISSTRKFPILVITSIVLCVVSRFPNDISHGANDLSLYFSIVKEYASSLIFVFIGTALYNYCSNKRSAELAKRLAIQVTVLLSLFCFAHSNSTVLVSYILGLAIFFASFICRRVLKKNVSIAWIADISYPLFLTHNILGTLLLILLLGLLSSPILCIVICSLAVPGLSYLLHIFVEQPCNDTGKALIATLKDSVNRLLSKGNRQSQSVYTKRSEISLIGARPKIAYVTALTAVISLGIIVYYYAFPVIVHYGENRILKLPCKLEARLPANANQTPWLTLDCINGHVNKGDDSIAINKTQEPEIVLNGWALRPQEQSLAGGVFVILDKNLVIPAHYGVARPDVANFFRQPNFRDCGYVVKYPSKLLNRGVHTIALAVMYPDQEHYCISPHRVSFTIQ